MFYFFWGLACSPETAKPEASTLMRLVTDLRMAENEHKRGPLERLRGFSCVNSEVCDVRRACLEAFDHHVRGVELGEALRKELAREQKDDEKRAATLLEMNIEVEEGRKAMPQCDERVAELRRRYRL